MRKKILSAALVLAMTATAFTGCGKTSSGREATDFDASKIQFDPGVELTKDKITLTVWESAQGPDEFIRIAGKKFEEKYPNIKINYVNVESTDANSKIAMDGPAGTGADLFATAHNNSGVMAKGGYIEPVPAEMIEKVKASCTESAFAGATLNTADGNSVVYGYPVSVETYALFYNKKLIKKEEIPTTMADLATFIKDYNSSHDEKAFLFDSGNAYYSVMFTSSPTNKLYGEKGNDIKNTYMNSDEAVAQMADFVALSEAIGLKSGDISYTSNDALFSAGKLAMNISGAWNIPAFQEAGVDFGITTIPSLTGSTQPPTNFMGVRCMFVSAYSEHKNEAAAFALWLMTEEMQQVRCELTSTLPARDGILDKIDDADITEHLGAIQEQIKYSYPMPSMPQTSLFWSAYGTAYGNIWNGEATDIKSELDKANDTATK